MSASITLESRFDYLEEYINKNFVNNTIHFFVGRPYPWENEDAPDIALSDEKSMFETRHAINYLRKLTTDNIIKSIKRFDWESGTIYTQVENDNDYTDIRYWEHPESPFYILNSEGNIYKCISNNYGAASTEEPTGQSTNLTLTSDGYIWKFMFDLSTDVLNDFLCDNWIPVPEGDRKTAVHSSVESAAIDGAIQFIRVDNQGIQYGSSPTIVIEGDGTGCVAVPVVSSGRIIEIEVTNPGSGYTYADIKIYGEGSDAAATAMISPKGGHGSNAVRELGAFFLTVSVELLGDSEGFPAWSTYRQIGLIRGIQFNDDTPVTDDNITTLSQLNIEFASGSFTNGEIVKGETSESFGKLYYDEPGDDTNIHLFDVYGTFLDGETIHGQTSEVNAIYHQSGSVFNEINVDSGVLIYKENIKFITRNTLQIEKFIFTIEF